LYEDAYVYDLDGKNIGKVSRVLDSDYLLVKKRGLLTDEEFRVPISCISHFTSSDGHLSIRLNINRDRLKYGFEVLSGASGGAIPSSHQPNLIPTSKEVIRYTVNEAELKNKEQSDLEHNITNSSFYKNYRTPRDTFFVCEMCMERFDKQEKLQVHRGLKHNAATGI
jgi:hypothetical protein